MKNNRYLLGVDGGNTKTDYFLFDLDGNFVDAMRFGTCSHEALSDSFNGTRRVMSEQIYELLHKNNIKIDDIVSAAFGLAGADTVMQKMKLNEVISSIGFQNYILENDGMLGVKAGSIDGTGVCSINGTGTVTIGMDDDGNFLQVGGVGYISGDEAGGAYLVRRAIQAVYDELYRMGKKTIITQNFMKMYDITDKSYFLDIIVSLTGSRLINRTEIITMIFDEALNGDEVANDILRETGTNMALSVAGCINNLHFTKEIQIILAGSVWSKVTNDLQIKYFDAELKKHVKMPYQINILKETPASGAILWAYEIYHNQYPDDEIKEKIKNQIIEAQNNLPTT